jgi:hypothetical protein
VERLLNLARPRESRLHIRVEPRPAGFAADRLDPARPLLSRPLRLNEPACFALQADQDCEAALVNIGSTGGVTVVLPNACQPRARMRPGGICLLPGPTADFDIVPTGPPGRERLLALAWLREPPVSLRPDGDDLFRELTLREVETFCEGLERMDGNEWSACVCEFEILP